MLESLLRISRSVRRTGAGKYLLVMLISFALSVTLTRAFLNLTGFPQLGGGNLHIAHVLWGGLLLYIAAIIPILYANRWVYTASATLCGLGIGLFIDEVGKFITSSNDYFFPPAAPIIYSFFVITTLLYTRIRRHRIQEPRAALYKAFDMMEEVLEHEMDSHEKNELLCLLNSVKTSSDDTEYNRLADALIEFIQTEKTTTIERQTFFTDKIHFSWQKICKKVYSYERLHWFTSISVLLLGIWNLIYPLRFFISLPNTDRFPDFIQPYIEMNIITSHSSLDWLTARVSLQAMVGLILLNAAIFLLRGKLEKGLSFSFLGMLLQLTTLDMLIFYYDQFSTIVFVLIQVVIFLAIQQYRRSIGRLPA